MSTDAGGYGTPETRRRILEAAWGLIEERGAEVRVADVAARAGVSRQAVYLHFEDRTGLLVALVTHMDATIGIDQLLAPVFDAPTGVDALERLVAALATAAPSIDAVALVLETGQHQDVALATAFRDRMARRRATHGMVVQRLAAEGRLAQGWTIEAATDLCYAVTMPALWRELTQELDWTEQQYLEHVTRLLRDSLVTDAGTFTASSKPREPTASE